MMDDGWRGERCRGGGEKESGARTAGGEQKASAEQLMHSDLLLDEAALFGGLASARSRRCRCRMELCLLTLALWTRAVNCRIRAFRAVKAADSPQRQRKAPPPGELQSRRRA